VTGTLTGRVIFHGQWPDSGTVQLSIFQNWSVSPCAWCGKAPGGPPSYYTEAHYFHDPDTTNGDGPDTMTYTISGIALGTYNAAAVGWRAPVISDMACDEPVIGLYGADPFTTDSIPQSLTFTSAQPMLEGVDVHAYFNIPTPAGCDSPGTISGVVRDSRGHQRESVEKPDTASCVATIREAYCHHRTLSLCVRLSRRAGDLRPGDGCEERRRIVRRQSAIGGIAGRR